MSAFSPFAEAAQRFYREAAAAKRVGFSAVAVRTEDVSLAANACAALAAAEDNRKLVDNYFNQKGLIRNCYYDFYIKDRDDWPQDGEWLVAACLQDNGINAWPGDGTGIVSGIIGRALQRAVAAEAKIKELEKQVEELQHAAQI